MLGISRPQAATLTEVRILFDLVREEIGHHLFDQQLVEGLVLIDTRHLARDHFPGSFRGHPISRSARLLRAPEAPGQPLPEAALDSS